jgi:RHS repeat-associated protein
VVTTLSYGSYGLASIKDPFNRYTYVTVVSDGRLTGIQDPDGVSTTFGHDGSLRLQTITDRAGKTTTLTYDSQSGKLASVIAPTVAVFQKGNVNPTTWFDPWQKDGVPYTATVDNPFPSPRRDSVDALVRAPDSTVTRYRDVDRHGQPRYALLPLGQGSTAYYNVDGQLTSASSSFGPTATYTYDASGFLTHAAVDNVDVWQRNGGWGQPDSLWGDIAPQRVFLNPANGRVDSIRLAGDTGLVTNLWYDAHGRIQYARDPEGHLLTYTWYGGTNGNRSKDSLPGGRVATYLYDTYGRDTSVSATGQPTRRVGYDLLNRPIRTYDGAYWTYFAYDSLYLKSVTDAKNQVYQFSRNALGAVTARIDPAGRQEQYEYGLAGELRRYVNRRGQADTLAYDSLLRRTVQAGGNSTPDTLGYSANGRVITGKSETTIETVYLNVRQQPDSIRTVFRSDTTKRFWRRFTYDTARRVFEVTGTGSALSFHDRKYVRNASSGLLAVLWLGDRYTGGIGYNKDLQDTVVPLPGPAHRISRRFTSLHGVTRDSSAAMYDRYHYDELHRIDRAGHSAGFLSGKQHVYGYDGLGRLSSVSFRNVLGCMWTFDPDAGYYCFWLEQDSLQNFTHDQVGNRTDHGGTYDVGNRITAFDNCTYGYDYDGNVTSRSCPGQTVTFTWNARNQLVSYVVSGDTVKLRYDAFGRLVRQWGGSVPDQRFLWERDHLFAALNSGLTAVEAEYSYYPGVDNPHAMVVGTTQYFMHTDGVGNVVGMTDTLKRLKRTYVYDAWGRVVAGTDSGDFGAKARPRFKGALWFGDAGVELYYMRNRWYESRAGRFLSEDPIGLNGGINQYAYALEDPINARDPGGLHPCGGEVGPHVHTQEDSTGQVIVVGEDIACASKEDQRRILDWLARQAALGTLVWHESRTTVYTGLGVDLVVGLGTSLSAGWWFDSRGNAGIYVSIAALVGADVSVQAEFGRAPSWLSMFGLTAAGEASGPFVGGTVWSNGREAGGAAVGGWSLLPASASTGGSVTIPIRLIRGR